MKSEGTKIALDDATDSVTVMSKLRLTNSLPVLLEADNCMRQTVYFGGRARNNNKWFDTECRTQKREARRALSRYTRSGSAADKTVYREVRARYQATIKEKKKNYRNSVRESLLANKNDSSKFWSTVRNARRKTREQPQINSKTWKNHFERILRQQNLPQRHCDTLPEIEVEDEDVYVRELDEQISLTD